MKVLPLVAAPQLAILLRFWGLAGGFWRGRQGRAARLIALGVLALNATEVALLLRFSTWNRDLFDALERRDGHAILLECGMLVVLAGGFALVAFLHLRSRRRLALGWRAWLAQNLTMGWLREGGGRGAGGANADGRIAEDARIATEEAVELTSSLTYATMMLGCFVGVLWQMSAHAPFTLGGVEVAVPGYLVWLAILYAGLGAAIPAMLGRPLERATNRRQAMEAEYREALTRARDSDGVHGLQVPRLRALFDEVAGAFRSQTGAFAHLQLFCVGSARFGQGFPILAATPAYLAGVVTLGWVIQAAQSFTFVHAALSWPVDNMPRIATWRASAQRVLALHEGVVIAPGSAAAALQDDDETVAA